MKIRNPLLLVLIVAVFVVMVLGYLIRKSGRVVATRSCISSVAAAIDSLNKATFEQTLSVGPNWMFLNSLEADRLIRKAEVLKSFDCDDWRPGDSLVDNWGHPIQIAVRRVPEQEKIEFRVWSIGPDGSPNTSDDIVSPFGASVPMTK